MPTQYLIAISIIGWGIGYIFYKIANNSIHPFMVTTITTAVYLIITPIIFLTLNFNKTLNINGVVATIIGSLLIGVGSIAYYFAIRNGNVGLITATTSLYPIITLIGSMLFLGESLSTKQLIGVLLACISFYFLSWK